MGNLTKGQRAAEEQIKAKIVEGHRRGICDAEGRSVRNAHGAMVARPPTRNYTYTRVFPRRDYR
jgi:hypothetical protein